MKKNNKDLADFSGRKFELKIFENIEFKIMPHFILKLALGVRQIYVLAKSILPERYKSIERISDSNVAEIAQTSTSVYLDGYFQNPEIFSHVRSALLEKFKFPPLPTSLFSLGENIKRTNSVSIHVRRGDYLHPANRDYHGVLNVSYYERATKHIAENVANPFYFIFSDDIDWCKENLFVGGNCEFVSNKTAPSWIDMALMSQCKHHIIANSSYSWWGAWLSTNNDKLVIAPRSWFANGSISKIIPKEWIGI
ncbi:MAG: alpha-1,2-fucosyltransferase [Flavobacterium sp.]|nr:MAG: alpha-1,2-fucosyltransferase [Flavobacterium sp.]